jgi:cytochrome b involved in lipid metabolism
MRHEEIPNQTSLIVPIISTRAQCPNVLQESIHETSRVKKTPSFSQSYHIPNSKQVHRKAYLSPGYFNNNFSGKSINTDQLPRIPMSEVQKHNTEKDAWTVCRGMVYNITPFMELHPGGRTLLMKTAGKDCTQLFDIVHPWVNVQTLLATNLVGICVDDNSGLYFRSKASDKPLHNS